MKVNLQGGDGKMTVLYRKIAAASIAATLHSILLGLLFPNPFWESVKDGYFWSFMSWTPVYMSYVFPAMFTYGILTSVLSDKAGSWIARKSGDSRLDIMVSGSLHLVFGLVLLWFSLPGAVLFFLIDRLLSKFRSTIQGSAAAFSLLIPLLFFALFVGAVSIRAA